MCRLVGSVSHTTSSGHPRHCKGLHGVQHFTTRILRRLDAGWDGIDSNAVDPTFEKEFAECRARWPRFYLQDYA